MTGFAFAFNASINFHTLYDFGILQDMQGSKVLGDEAGAIYDRAITGIMKHSMLLYFAYADFEEVIKKKLC